MKIASGIFRKITNNKWTGLGVSMEDSQPMILSSSNEPIAPEVLSRGAQEQAYLALRLAYIESHAKQAEPLPVIMDEILVNFDPARAERTAKAIISLGNIPNQQLFYFTCHPDMVTLLKAASPHSPVYSVADKKITKNTDY